MWTPVCRYCIGVTGVIFGVSAVNVLDTHTHVCVCVCVTEERHNVSEKCIREF